MNCIIKALQSSTVIHTQHTYIDNDRERRTTPLLWCLTLDLKKATIFSVKNAKRFLAERPSLIARIIEIPLGPGRCFDMIDNPGFWPMKDYLPVKRHIERRIPGSKEVIEQVNESGYVLEVNTTKVFIGNIYDFPSMKSIQYENIEDLLKDGWIVN